MEPNYTTRVLSYAMKTCGFYPLRPMQVSLFDMQLTKARSTMLNMHALFKLDDRIDMERLAKAVNDTLNNHDVFHCRFVFHPGTSDLCQRFDGEIIPVKVERLSDEEFELRKKNLVTPYQLIDAPLHRIYLFETPTAKYLYVDFHHALFDAVATNMIFAREMDLRYCGKPPRCVAPKYADLITNELLISPDELARGNAYWRDMLKGFDIKKHLPPADVKNCQSPQEEIVIYQFQNITSKYFHGMSYTENNFLLAATMLALAKSAGSKNSIMTWLHTGRTKMQDYRIMGIMIEQFPIAWDFEENMTVRDYLNGLEDKINYGMRYRRSLEVVYTEGLQDNCATFIFQKGTISTHNNIVSIDGTESEMVELDEEDGDYPTADTLDFEFHAEDSGHYSLELAYVTSRYSQKAMQILVESLDEIILQLQDEDKTLGEIINLTTD